MLLVHCHGQERAWIKSNTTIIKYNDVMCGALDISSPTSPSPTRSCDRTSFTNTQQGDILFYVEEIHTSVRRRLKVGPFGRYCYYTSVHVGENPLGDVKAPRGLIQGYVALTPMLSLQCCLC